MAKIVDFCNNTAVWDGRTTTGPSLRDSRMMISRHRLLGFVLGVAVACPAMAQEADNMAAQSDAFATNYVGDNIRVGVGYNSETRLTGEFFWSFAEKPESAWIAEGWVGDESAGGVKLNFHWLSGGVQAGQDEDGNPVYSDGKVRKFFMAADRNRYDDGKLSLGFGGERENRFWSLYGSRSTSGERYIGQNIVRTDQLVTGIIDNHAFSRTDTLETITDYFAHPYDWGVGFRVGRYFDDALVRLRGGLDYESGDFDSSQLTAFASLDKRFADSPHGLSLRAEVLHKDGDFEIDRRDFRVTAMWTWEFGNSFQPASVYRDVERERIPDASELPRKEVVEVVQNRVTLDNTASFELDSDKLNEAALAALRQIVASLSNARIAGDVLIVGHTCSLGTDEYNQALSERRAKTVFNYLASQGIRVDILKWEGHGEHEPRYSNDTEDSRKQNRRVEITFTAEEEIIKQVIVGEGQPITEWVQEAVPVEAAWIRRALRNPVVHKRSVDFYRINRVTENLITGETFIENSGPSAADDMYTLEQNSSNNSLSVLANDSDAEGDDLTIVSVSSPAHGTAVISGNQVNYTPDAEYYGNDSFTYAVEDGYGGTATATVTIVIERLNTAPAAVDDEYVVNEDSVANMLDILANDSDAESDSFTIISVTTPAHGTVSINGDMVSYTPNPGYFGPDVFEYIIEDSPGLQASATVNITVVEVNDPPIAVDDSARTLKGYSEIIDVLANDSDPNGDPLTVIEIMQSDHPMGFVVINPDGTLKYTPMAGWWGGDSFQYRISDGRGGTAVGTVTVDVVTLISKP